MSSTADTMGSMGFFNPFRLSSFFEDRLFCPFYDKLNEVAQENSSIVRWVSPVVGIADGIGKLIVVIGSIFEAAIKGIGNLAVGVITFNAYLLKTGSKQLVFFIPVRFISILFHLFKTLLLTKNLIFDPEKATREEAERYLTEDVFF